MKRLIVVLILVTILIGACGTSPTALPTYTPYPTHTAVVPTDTPEPTATPFILSWAWDMTAEEAIEAFFPDMDFLPQEEEDRVSYSLVTGIGVGLHIQNGYVHGFVLTYDMTRGNTDTQIDHLMQTVADIIHLDAFLWLAENMESEIGVVAEVFVVNGRDVTLAIHIPDFTTVNILITDAGKTEKNY